MQQIYLTGPKASEVAAWVLTSLRVKTAGYCIVPLEVEGQVRGQALRLLTVPDEPYHNNVPCMAELAPGKQVFLREVFNQIAAPELRQAASAHVPVFMDCITAEMLKAADFAEAVAACLRSRSQVIAVAADNAVRKLRAMTDAENQLWLTVDEANQNDIMRLLQQEVSMRL